ncbi:MAG: hypothetical protein GY861_18455 [bacterium]|nr:hypothetical protein [bacterium]
MTGTEFASYIRQSTNTDSTSFTDAEIIVWANIMKDEMSADMTEAFTDYFQIPYTTSLVADQREYAIPANFIKVKRLEAKIDGTNFVKVTPFDISNDDRPLRAETDITSAFSSQRPKYDYFRGSIKIYSGTISAVTNGLAGDFIVYPSAITADGAGSTLDLTGSDDLSVNPSTTAAGVPRNFHMLWADGVVIKYKNTRDRPIPLTEGEQMWQQRFAQQISVFKDTNSDEMVEMVGEDPWNNTNRTAYGDYNAIGAPNDGSQY